MRNTRDNHRFEKDKKSDFCSTKKDGMKANHVNQNFAQTNNKLDKLEKSLMKSSKKLQKRRYKDSDSDS
jgi:hypothetical protein